MNLFEIPETLPDGELTECLCRGGARVERIVSHGQRSPDGFWYDQDEDEWVSVLAGNAELRLEGGGVIRLFPGDCLLIPARRRHRVEKTSAEPPCIWLCVFGRLSEISGTQTTAGS